MEVFMINKYDIEFKKKCDLNNLIPFNYENDVYDYCLQLMKEKNLNYNNWVNLFSQYKKLFPNEYNELKQLIDNDIHFEFSKEIIIALRKKGGSDTKRAIIEYFRKNSEVITEEYIDFRRISKKSNREYSPFEFFFNFT